MDFPVRRVATLLSLAALTSLALPAQAVEPLDTFSVRLGGYTSSFDTEIRANGETTDGTEVDLERDLSVYLSSEVRSRHAEFIAGLDPVEREGDAEAEPYLSAYRQYLAHLDTLIHDEESRGRERHLPVLHRLSDALHRHVRGITLDESRPL